MNAPRVTLVSALGISGIAVTDYEPPLGVLTLAAILRQSVSVRVVDIDDIWLHSGRNRSVFEATVIEAILSEPSDVLGFSTICGSYPLTIRLAERVKREWPRCPVIFGGPQATVTDVSTLQTFPFIDMILRGEAGWISHRI